MSCAAAASAIARPVPVLPVKLTVFTSGESTRRFAPAAPDSMKRLTAPLGRSGTEARISLISAAVCAACIGILTAAVQPAASAGASARIDR